MRYWVRVRKYLNAVVLAVTVAGAVQVQVLQSVGSEVVNSADFGRTHGGAEQNDRDYQPQRGRRFV